MMPIGGKRLGGHQLVDLFVLVVLACFVAWYLTDSIRASSHLLNLIMVVPVSVIVLALCAVEFSRQLLRRQPGEEKRDLEPAASVIPIVVLFTLYVSTLQWLGFDVGTALFISGSLWFHGERRLIWNLGYAICFAVLASLLFSQMLPYPMPMLVLTPGS